MPVYGTPFTLELLKGKLEEHQVSDRCELRNRGARRGASIGRSRCGSCGSRTRSSTAWRSSSTRRTAILHTGDFKIDQTPLDGRPTDLHGLAEEASGRGVHLLLSDSTNAEEAGYTDSERTVGPVLQRIVEHAPGIVVAACFSSHIHRVQQIVNAARANERVAAFLGRSMLNSAAARRLGYLQIDDRDVIDIAEVADLDPGRVVVIRTGSQGEPFSALSDGAAPAQVGEARRGRHRRAVVVADPGNEPAIHRVVDAVYRTGADVYHMPADPVHASGHAAAEELRLMLSLVRPRLGSSRSTGSVVTCSTTRDSPRRSASRATTS